MPELFQGTLITLIDSLYGAGEEIELRRTVKLNLFSKGVIWSRDLAINNFMSKIG